MHFHIQIQSSVRRASYKSRLIHPGCREQIVNSVLDELGVGIGQEMASVPASKGKAQTTESMAADADLQARLDALKKA